MTYSSACLIVDSLPVSVDIDSRLYSTWVKAFQDNCYDFPVEVVTVDEWTPGVGTIDPTNQVAFTSGTLMCPLMLQLPRNGKFLGRSVYEQCGNVEVLRQQVHAYWGYGSGDGHHWLPIVLTAKGPLYSEVIGRAPLMTNDLTQQSISPYQQPIHVSDQWRQPLYQLGHNILAWLEAMPGVYLLQFVLEDDRVLFDRLWPFPHYPALASIGVQSPNLFECYWRCLTHQPILDLVISP